MAGRLGVSLRGMSEDIARGVARLGPPSSVLRWTTDVLLYRALRFSDTGLDRPRTVTTRDGTVLSYRLNRGDITVLVEVWLLDVYRMPDGCRPKTVVDLGANVGLTSLWLAKQYGVERIVAVEPVPANVEVARRNLVRSGAAVVLLEGAVGAEDGTARFRIDRASTTGGTEDGEDGYEVRVFGMDTVLANLPDGLRIDLMKIDIEGGEESIVSGDLSWLERCDRIIAEIHPDNADAARVIDVICGAGFVASPLTRERSYGGKGTEFMVWFERPAAA